MQQFEHIKMHLNMSSAEWLSFCLDRNVLYTRLTLQYVHTTPGAPFINIV